MSFLKDCIAAQICSQLMGTIMYFSFWIFFVFAHLSFDWIGSLSFHAPETHSFNLLNVAHRPKMTMSGNVMSLL